MCSTPGSAAAHVRSKLVVQKPRIAPVPGGPWGNTPSDVAHAPSASAQTAEAAQQHSLCLDKEIAGCVTCAQTGTQQGARLCRAAHAAARP